MFCGGNKTLMSNITAPWWSELPRGWKEVFCNTEETKLKFSCVTLKNKISACNVALWIACEKALHLRESRFTRHKWRACQQTPLGRTIDNSAGLVSLVSSPWRSPFWGLFGLIRSHHTPHALLACLQLSPFSLVPCSPLSLGKACRRGRRDAHHRTVTLLLCLESLSFTTVSNCEGRAQIEWRTRERPRTTEQHQGHSTV